MSFRAASEFHYTCCCSCFKGHENKLEMVIAEARRVIKLGFLGII